VLDQERRGLVVGEDSNARPQAATHEHAVHEESTKAIEDRRHIIGRTPTRARPSENRAVRVKQAECPCVRWSKMKKKCVNLMKRT
jgi:hypothetical protein